MDSHLSNNGLSVGVLNRAFEEARKSTYKFRLGCVIFKGNRILASGHNAIRYTNAVPDKYRQYNNSLHAELSTIINYFSQRGKNPTNNGLSGASLLVVRISSKLEIVDNAKPCFHCMNSIRYFGIDKIYYSNRKGEIVLL